MGIQTGKPFSTTLPKQDYRATRAIRAMQQLSEDAKKNGTSEMIFDEINAEIAASRKERDEREGKAL